MKARRCLVGRLLSRIRVNGSCWDWTGPLNTDGYGKMHAIGEQRAHRIAYRLFVGPIPAGKLCLHRCDRRSCCAPNHLYLGDQFDNMRDASERCRMRGKGKAPLTREQIADIRKRRAAGERLKTIAADHGISQVCVSHIATGRSHRHVVIAEVSP